MKNRSAMHTPGTAAEELRGLDLRRSGHVLHEKFTDVGQAGEGI